MNNKRFKALFGAYLTLVVVGLAKLPAIVKGERSGQISTNRTMSIDATNVDYGNRVYSDTIQRLFDAYQKGVSLENSYAVNSEFSLNADLDTAYNAYEVMNFRFPFDGLTEDELKAEALKVIQFIERTTYYAINNGVEEGLPSRYAEDELQSLSLKNTEDLCKRLIANPNDKNIWDEVFEAIRGMDRYAYMPNIEMIKMMLLSNVLPYIPANYIYTEPETGYITPKLGYRIRAIDEFGEEISILLFAVDEEGNLFEEWSYKRQNDDTPIEELKGYLQGDAKNARTYTLAELKVIAENYPGVLIDEESNEVLGLYGITRDTRDVETKSIDAMYACIMANAIDLPKTKTK